MADPDSRRDHVGMFLNLAGERRTVFQSECGEMFGRLLLADTIDTAVASLGRQKVDLMVVDLGGFEGAVELAAGGALIRGRNGAPTLVLCPYVSSCWLPELMACGPLHYRITPILAAETQQAVRQALAALEAQLELLSPQRTLERGYSILSDHKGRLIRSTKQLQPNTSIGVRTADDSAEVGISSVQPSLE